MKSKLTKQERERLDNRIVFLSSVTILYAILLIFIQKMMSSSMTVNGAIAFIQILRWGSLGGAMLCAAWSAYKEKRDFFVYCGVCIFIFFSNTIILYCGHYGKNFIINYISLFLIFCLIQAYYVLKARNMFVNKNVRVAFLSVCVVLAAAVAVVSIMQRFGF